MDLIIYFKNIRQLQWGLFSFYLTPELLFFFISTRL